MTLDDIGKQCRHCRGGTKSIRISEGPLHDYISKSQGREFMFRSKFDYVTLALKLRLGSCLKMVF
ncbi:hypothetical protein TIFTF001_019487 [Ficus carica]|uniref:Uncharacterized protein n=1 Tax=Ficus carica TaxID=3494 RepID=A0AA88AWZ6_FICCA|nr:hypothetical protein TIFTF001_019487 [Ficus carica]